MKVFNIAITIFYRKSMRNFLAKKLSVSGLLITLIFVLLTSISNNVSQAEEIKRILFIGNSYTYMNDLPKMFEKLSLSGGQKIETGMLTNGGWKLAQHIAAKETDQMLKSAKWNYVVVQEQSRLPASEEYRNKDLYPSARLLVNKIRSLDMTPIFYMTWGHRDGWKEEGLPNYESMQLAINEGYLKIAKELKVAVAPVGEAWRQEQHLRPNLDFWVEDGSHPTEQGTYLAACVFYATIFKKDPQGIAYTAGLSTKVAKQLQKVASDVVLNDQEQWNLPL